MVNLDKAAQQWARRPEEERFWTLAAARKYLQKRQGNGEVETTRKLFSFADANTVYLTSENGINYTMNHWSFGQVANLAGAPASFLRRLPLNLAANSLDHVLRKRPQQTMLLGGHDDWDGRRILRAATGPKYTRIWDERVVGHCEGLQEGGWRVPPGRPPGGYTGHTRIATDADCLSGGVSHPTLGIRPGMEIAPSGLYASDQDCFVFMVDMNVAVKSPGGPLYRGFFYENSEVGGSSLRVTMFLFNAVCGNHIVWGAKQVNQFEARHVGQKIHEFEAESTTLIRRYHDMKALGQEADIQRLVSARIADSRPAVIKLLVGKAISTTPVVESAYEAAAGSEDVYNASPMSPWGMIQGLTEIAQTREYASQRTALERAAGKLVDMYV